MFAATPHILSPTSGNATLITREMERLKRRVIWVERAGDEDGRRIAFIGANAEGRSGVFVQDFAPGRDTSASRRPVAGFAPDVLTESLGVSPDGKNLVISTLQEYSSLMLAEGLAGFEPPRR